MRASIVSAVAFAATILAQRSAGACSPLELIYARATTEPTGFGFAGNALVARLRKDVPGASSYAVVYPATMDLNGGGCKGVRDVMRRLEERSKACPNQTYALGGHSQGGAVVTAAIKENLVKGSDIEKRIIAVTMFGSPPCTDFPDKIEPARCRSFCNKGDDICDPGPRGKFQAGGPRVKCSGGKDSSPGAGGGAKGKGRGKGKGGASGVSAMSLAQDFSFLSSSEYLEKRQGPKGAGGAGNGCGEVERGHSTGATGLAAHIAYASNGYYITAASCFIKKKFSEHKQT